MEVRSTEHGVQWEDHTPVPQTQQQTHHHLQEKGEGGRKRGEMRGNCRSQHSNALQGEAPLQGIFWIPTTTSRGKGQVIIGWGQSRKPNSHAPPSLTPSSHSLLSFSPSLSSPTLSTVPLCPRLPSSAPGVS